MIINIQNPNFKKSVWLKLVIAVIALFAFAFLAGFLFPVFLAIALSFVLYPLVNLLRKPFFGHRMPRVLAIALSFIVALGACYLLIAYLVVPLFIDMNKLLAQMPQMTAASQNTWEFFLNPESRETLPSNVRSIIDQGMQTLNSHVVAWIQGLVLSTLNLARNLAGLVIVPFLSFYFLKDWRELRSMVIGIFPYNNQALVEQVLNDIGKMLSAYVKDMVKLCLIAGVCLTTGASLLGVQFPTILGFMAVLAEMVPLLGPIIGSVPAIFIAYTQEPRLALKVAVFYLVYYQLDGQVIMPNIMGRSIALHPVLIILGVLLGGKLFGIMGLVFAVPTVAVCKIMYVYFWHRDEEVEASENSLPK